MGELIVHEPLASELRREAEAQGQTVESLLETILRKSRFQAQRLKLTAEAEWWRGVSAERRARYAGEFVAIHAQAVVDHDQDEDALRQRIRARYGKTPVLITPAEGRRELRLVSS